MKNGINALITQGGNVLEDSRDCDFGLFVTDNAESNQIRTVIGGDASELNLIRILGYSMAAVFEKAKSMGYSTKKIKAYAEALCFVLLDEGPTTATEIDLENWGE